MQTESRSIFDELNCRTDDEQDSSLHGENCEKDEENEGECMSCAGVERVAALFWEAAVAAADEGQGQAEDKEPNEADGKQGSSRESNRLQSKVCKRLRRCWKKEIVDVLGRLTAK